MDVIYESITPRYGNFDLDRCRENIETSDLIIAQAVENKDNEFSREKLHLAFQDRIVFYPYIYADGFFSMSFFPAGPNVQPYGVMNFEPVLESLLEVGFQETILRYRKGDINFHHVERLEGNIEKARANERYISIKWVDDFEELIKSRRLMITHNHPNPELLNLISKKISGISGLNFREVKPDEHVLYSLVTLPNPGAVVTPFAVSELGLKYDYDLQWFPTGRRLITHINKMLEDAGTAG